MIFAWFVLFIEGVFAGTIQPSADGSDTVTVLAIVIHSVVMIGCLTSRLRDRYGLNRWIVGGYLIRLACLIWDNIGRNIWHFPDWGDTFTFASTAKGFYEGITTGRGGLYPQMIAYMYRLTNVRPLFAQYVNVVLAMTSVVIIYQIFQKVKLHPNNVKMGIIAMCFLPYLAIDNSLLLRESLIQFLIAASLFCFIEWCQKGPFRNLLIACILPIFAALFHSGAIAPLVGYAVCVILYDRNERKIRITLKTMSLAIVMAGVFMAIYTMFGEQLFSKYGNLDEVSDLVNAASSHTAGGASYSVGVEASNWLELIRYTPVRMFYFVASPVPWSWRGLTDIISFAASSLFYIVVLGKAFRVIFNKRIGIGDKSKVAVFLIVALAGALVFSWGVSNAGAAMRHRDKFVSIYVVLLVFSLEAERRYKMS